MGNEGLWRDWEMNLGHPWGSYLKETNTTQSWTLISQTKSAQPYCCALNYYWVRNRSPYPQGTGLALYMVGSLFKYLLGLKEQCDFEPLLFHHCAFPALVSRLEVDSSHSWMGNVLPQRSGLEREISDPQQENDRAVLENWDSFWQRPAPEI